LDIVQLVDLILN